MIPIVANLLVRIQALIVWLAQTFRISSVASLVSVFIQNWSVMAILIAMTSLMKILS